MTRKQWESGLRHAEVSLLIIHRADRSVAAQPNCSSTLLRADPRLRVSAADEWDFNGVTGLYRLIKSKNTVTIMDHDE